MDAGNSQKVSAGRRPNERVDSLTHIIKNADRLARVRENQRKSRARKQEYVRELEQRLAAWKEQVQHKDIEHRLAVQKLEAENRHLKTLLFSLGVSPEIVHQYTQAADQSTDVGRKVAIPAMQRPMETSSVSSSHGGSGTRCSSAASYTPINPNDQPGVSVVAEQLPVNAGGCAPAAPYALEQQSQAPGLPDTSSLCCQTDKPQAGSNSTDDDVLNTTLCAIAEDLISQYNTRGVDMDGIQQRLCARQGESTDGCRVQNHLLFQVLDEISNNI